MGKRMLWVCGVLVLAVLWGQPERAEPVDAQVSLKDTPRYIALTFDDGPRRETTARLLDGLRERGASATFFLVGEQIGANRDLVRRMKAEGHQVGSHTWSHTRLEGLDRQAVLRELGKTDALLEEILGAGDYWVRPPYGQIGEERALVREPLILWSVDTRDWESRNTEQVVEAALRDAGPGSIILMHDIYPTTVEAALQVVDALEEEGYWFVTVEELFALRGIRPRPGQVYRSAR